MSGKATVKTMVKTNHAVFAQFQAGLNFARNMDVLVGIPAESNGAHKGAAINNSQLLYIHENGAPGAGIPARPVLQIGIKDAKADVQKYLASGIKNAFAGNMSGAMQDYKLAGQTAQNSIQGTFGSDALSPLKPATARRRKMGSAAPLIDTGALRAAIRFVVRTKR